MDVSPLELKQKHVDIPDRGSIEQVFNRNIPDAIMHLAAASYVDNHARALRLVLEQGETGETYDIGGHNEKINLDVVQ